MNEKTKVSVFTLGCKTNLYESRQIVAELLNEGFDAVEGLAPADVYVINTCAVTNEAERKSRQAVTRCRKLNPNARIVVCGCASEHNPEQFGENVKFVKGTVNKTDLVKKLFDQGIEKDALPQEYGQGVFAAHCKTRDFIKIQDGCDRFCSYCIIPYLRGRSRSRAAKDILAEAEQSNAKEIVLTGVDLSDYGRKSGSSLAQLCRMFAPVKARKRLGSLEVNIIDDDLLDAMDEGGFCPHFHLSLQSGSGKVLKEMNRHYTPSEFFSAVQRIRKRFPLAGVTTDVIVGYPTETEKDFEDSMRFCRETGFSDLHVFPFSPRAGTVAARLQPLTKSVLAERATLMNQLKTLLKSEFAATNLGRTQQVLTEDEEGGYSCGYTPNYLRVFVKGKVESNTLTDVTIGEEFKDGCLGFVK